MDDILGEQYLADVQPTKEELMVREFVVLLTLYLLTLPGDPLLPAILPIMEKGHFLKK